MPADVADAVDKLTFRAGGAADPGDRPPVPAFDVIQVCLDASRESDVALRWARHLAMMSGARVLVASVFPPPQVDPLVAGAYAFYPNMASAYGELQERLKEVAKSGAALLREDGIDAEPVFTVGRPVRELEEIARTRHADLVILGSPGRSALARLLGSTADALMDRVPASVLLARTEPPPTRVLAATDGSPSSRRAVAWALAYGNAARVAVTVGHVLDYPEGARLPDEEMLREAVGGMRLLPPPRVAYHLDAGRPAERIIATAETTGAGLVVLGSRGLGRVRGWLLGSVGRRVVAVAHASVLVVKDAP